MNIDIPSPFTHLRIYASSSYEETSFILSRVSTHLMNSSPIFTLFPLLLVSYQISREITGCVAAISGAMFTS